MQVLQIVIRKITEEKQIGVEQYALLVTMFPHVLAAALDILDHGKITKLSTDRTHRCFHRVKETPKPSESTGIPGIQAQDESSQVYDVKDDFCFCYYYARECLSDNGQSMVCKHVLAVKLGEALGVIQEKEVEERDWAPLLL